MNIGRSASLQGGVPRAFSVLAICVVAGCFLGASAQQMYGINYGCRSGTCASGAQVLADFAKLKQVTNRVKTFGNLDCDCGRLALEAALQNNMRVLLGIWLGTYDAGNQQEIQSLTRLLSPSGATPNYWRTVDAVIVGSETQFRKDITLAQYQGYINQARAALDAMGLQSIPIWIVDADPAYSSNPAIFALTNVYRYLVNIYPFFGGASIGSSGAALSQRISAMRGLANGKSIGVGETGWPSAGAQNYGAAFASEANYVSYLQQALTVMQAQADLPYCWFGSFDNNGKDPADVEGHWGLYYGDNTTPKPGVWATLKTIFPNLGINAPALPPPPPFQSNRRYVNCYADDWTRGFPFLLSSSVKSVTECEQLARVTNPSFKYIGLEWNTECYGGFLTPDAYNGKALQPAAACMWECSGTGGIGAATTYPNCGGSRALSTWELLAGPAPVGTSPPPAAVVPSPKPPSPRPPSPPVTTPRPPSPPSNTVYQGCWTDSVTARGMPVRLSTTTTSVAQCANMARAAGYTYIGLEWMSECWASRALPTGARSTVAADCMYACTGVGGVGGAVTYVNCGRGSRLATYRL